MSKDNFFWLFKDQNSQVILYWQPSSSFFFPSIHSFNSNSSCNQNAKVSKIPGLRGERWEGPQLVCVGYKEHTPGTYIPRLCCPKMWKKKLHLEGVLWKCLLVSYNSSKKCVLESWKTKTPGRKEGGCQVGNGREGHLPPGNAKIYWVWTFSIKFCICPFKNNNSVKV